MNPFARLASGQPCFRPWICFILTLWGLYLRTQRFLDREWWNDERYQLVHIVGPFKPFWKRFVYGDFTCFPGDYLVTYPFLRIFGLHQLTDPFPPFSYFDRFLLSLPHILATVLGFYFLYLVCGRYLQTTWGFLIAFSLFSFHKELIFHAFEFRPYAVLPTLSLAVFYFTGSLIQRNLDWPPLIKFSLGLFFGFAILFHSYGILMVALPFLFYLVVDRPCLIAKGTMTSYLRFFGMVFLISLPWWFWYATGNPLGVLLDPKQFDPFRFIPNPLVDMMGFLKGVLGNLTGNKKFYILLPGLLVAPFMAHRQRRGQLLFFLILIVVPIEIIFLLDLFKNYMFLQRQFIWVMPWFIFLLAWQWDSLINYFSNKPART